MSRAILCHALSDPDAVRLEEVASLPLGSGQVRIRTRAVGLNYPDVLMLDGKYQNQPPLPFVPGLEAAGDIIEIAPGVPGFRVGDKVMARPRDGSFREEIVVDADHVHPMPAAFDYAAGATFLGAHGTAGYALCERTRLQAGETLLVHGAGGGVGLAAVEIGKALGAHVIALTSNDAKRAVVAGRGADHILPSGEPFRDKVRELTQGRGADVIFDPVGGAVFEESLRCMNWSARVLVIGFLAGIGTARANQFLIKNASLLGVRAGEALRRDASFKDRLFARLCDMAEKGQVRPHVSHRQPLDRYADALRLLVERKAVGRVALEM